VVVTGSIPQLFRNFPKNGPAPRPSKRRKPIFSSHVIGMPPNRSEIRRGEAPVGVSCENPLLVRKQPTLRFKVRSDASDLLYETRSVFGGHELSCPIPV
jgi:hypothetical protein